MTGFRRGSRLLWLAVLLTSPGLAVARQAEPVLSALARQHDYDRYNRIVASDTAVLGAKPASLRVGAAQWRVDVRRNAVPGRPDATDLTVRFRLVAGVADQASVAARIAIPNWDPANFVMLPGAVYDGNRFPSRRLRYSPKLAEPQDFGPDSPTIITDIPRLGLAEEVSQLVVPAGAPTAPAIGLHDPRNQRGWWLLTQQGGGYGDAALGLEESRDRRTLWMTVSAPLVRELHAYRFLDNRAPSWDRAPTLKPGAVVTLHLRLFRFAAPTRQALFDRFADIRNDLTGAGQLAATMPYSVAFATVADKFNRDNWVEAHGYYAVGLRENFLQDWQIGWTGGMLSTYPLLAAGDARTRERVRRNFDWLFASGISPSGFYFDSGEGGTRWYGGDIRKPQSRNWHLIRKSGDALGAIVRQFRLMRRMGMAVDPAWEAGNRRIADAFVTLFAREGQLGQFVDSDTGRIAVGGSTSGASAVGGLVLAADYYREPRYLETAKQLARHYADRFTARGYTTGGPGDALQNPDSESSYALLEGYQLLHEATGDPVWRDLALQQARQYATWLVSYDYRFPAGSAYARLNMRTAGAVYANTQNAHAAPGICTASGVAIFRLYRATGDAALLPLIQPTAHNITQYVPHPDRPIGDSRFGHVSERINMVDWEGPGTVGYILPMSSWAETSVMMTTVDFPGVYVEPDRGRITVFDNVTARFVDAARDMVELTNPTRFPARVSILVEDAAERARPLPDAVAPLLKQVTVAPGAQVRLNLADHRGIAGR